MVVTAKRVFFSNSRSDFEDSSRTKLIDLELPLEVYLLVKNKMEKIDYLKTTDIPPNEITDHYREIFRDTSKFSVKERDRVWLFEQGNK